MIKFFALPILSLVAGLAFIATWSWSQSHEMSIVTQSLLTTFLLSILEISISLDNAIVNATVLEKMNDVWKRRFLTWGMLIAVFGMRFFFPLVIVSITGGSSLWASLQMALTKPEDYAKMMLDAHLAVSSFGGAFLLMVFLHFFIDDEKDSHWISIIEKPFQTLAHFTSAELLLALLILMGINHFMPESDSATFLTSAFWGLTVFLMVHGLSDLLGSEVTGKMKWLSGGLGLFLYLEVLDASFSFDGVIGAFALSKDLFVIVTGLSIGAFFVRGLTLYLVEKQTLKQFVFLEHGAFYALGALAFFMLLDPFFHFSEWLTALTGAVILALAIWGSIQVDRKGRAS